MHKGWETDRQKQRQRERQKEREADGQTDKERDLFICCAASMRCSWTPIGTQQNDQVFVAAGT